MAVKNWWDTAAPTMEMGGLLGMPSLDPTDEDKKNAIKQMLIQMGMGMAANSGKGTNAAIGAGLLGGVQGYQQGMQGPANRFEMAKQQLDFQGKQLGNAKAYNEVQQTQNLDKLLSGIGNVTGNPFEQVAQGNGAWGQGPLAPDSPEMQQGNAKAQAAMFSNPAFLAKLAANGMKGSDISALGGRFDPRQISAGGYSQNPMTGQMTYNADPVKGIGMGPQGVYNLPGSIGASQDRILGDKAAETMAELQRRLQLDPRDIQKAGAIAGAEAGAKDPFNFQTIQGPNGAPTVMTNPQLRGATQGNQFPGARVSPEQQAQRDQVRRQILADEGNDPNTPTRINDRPGAGLAPQLAGLPGIQGANPVVQKAKEAINTQWLEKTYQPLADAGAAAQSNLDNIKGLRSVDLKTGAGTQTLGALANWGAAFGIPQAEKYAGNVQQFRALALENVNKELNLAKGPQTDQDAQRAQSIFAQLGNTPRANEFLLDYRQAAEHQKQRAAAFHQDALPLATNSGDLSEVSRRWRKVAGSIWDDPIMQKWGKR